MATVLAERRHDAEFILSEANGALSRDTIVLARHASAVLPAGTVLELSAGKAVPFSDPGSTAIGILFATTDARAADVRVVILSSNAEVNAEALYIPDDDDGALMAAAVASLLRRQIRARSGPIEEDDGGDGDTTAFDPATKTTTMTLSNGNLTASTIAGGGGTAIAARGAATGKRYCEFTLTAVAAGVDHTYQQFGLLAGGAPQEGNYLGGQEASAGFTGQGFVLYNAVGVVEGIEWDGYDLNDTVGMAVDLDMRKVWLRTAGDWQGGGDPAAGTSPTFTYGEAMSGTIYPGVSPFADEANPSTFVANFGATPYAFAAPAGFANW